MEREDSNISTSKRPGNLSFSISSILNNNEETSKSDTEAGNSSDEESNPQIRVPLVQRPENSDLALAMNSSEFSPWLYRPTPLPGYLPLQTGFLTSRFGKDTVEKFEVLMG